MIVNNGVVLHGGNPNNAFGNPNNLFIGGGGGTGTLIVNGGQVLNSQALVLGDGTGAGGTLQLNGGLVQATQVRPNGTPTTSIANFNGGTLQAVTNSADFIFSTAMVQSGGAVLDDNGFAIHIASQSFQEDSGSPGGGLLKKGSGTVYLDSLNNAYTGTTVVTNGTLSGVGVISAPVVVATTGNLGAGAPDFLSTLTINSQPLTLLGHATLRISKNGGVPVNDLVAGMTTVNYGGLLVVTNTTYDSTPLVAGDTFTIFTATTHNGNFSGIVGSPGAGLAYSFTNGVLSVVTNNIANNPTNITISVSGSSLTLSWPTDHLGWILQAQTNSVSVGVSDNWVDVPGSESTTSVTVPLSPGNPSTFFRLRKP
jgi:autotransporter-associated beta strand protein